MKYSVAFLIVLAVIFLACDNPVATAVTGGSTVVECRITDSLIVYPEKYLAGWKIVTKNKFPVDLFFYFPTGITGFHYSVVANDSVRLDTMPGMVWTSCGYSCVEEKYMAGTPPNEMKWRDYEDLNFVYGCIAEWQYKVKVKSVRIDWDYVPATGSYTALIYDSYGILHNWRCRYEGK